MIFFLRYVALPSKTHPERAVLGEAYICCWVDRKSLLAADRAARRYLKSEKWDIQERDAGQMVTTADYDEDDEWFPYYTQALTDKEVYITHTSPRFPVLQVFAKVARGKPRETAAAYFFLAGYTLIPEDGDVAVPNFWNSVRRQRAIKAARAAITEAGWRVTRIVSEQPCGYRDTPEDFRLYYDEAETHGSCLVFVHDENSQNS